MLIFKTAWASLVVQPVDGMPRFLQLPHDCLAMVMAASASSLVYCPAPLPYAFQRSNASTRQSRRKETTLTFWQAAWGIENSYKSHELIRPRTTRIKYSIRVLCWFLPFILYNTWILGRFMAFCITGITDTRFAPWENLCHTCRMSNQVTLSVIRKINHCWTI